MLSTPTRSGSHLASRDVTVSTATSDSCSDRCATPNHQDLCRALVDPQFQDSPCHRTTAAPTAAVSVTYHPKPATTITIIAPGPTAEWPYFEYYSQVLQ